MFAIELFAIKLFDIDSPPLAGSSAAAFALSTHVRVCGVQMNTHRARRREALRMNNTMNQPSHKIFAIEDMGQDRSFFREIGAGWLNEKGTLNLKFKFRPLGTDVKLYIKDLSAEPLSAGSPAENSKARAPKIIKRKRKAA